MVQHGLFKCIWPSANCISGHTGHLAQFSSSMPTQLFDVTKAGLYVCRHHAEVLQRTADDNGWDRCGICCEALALEGHMKPRFLPCQHVLCSSCLVQCCSDGLVSCPWCREVHRPKFLVAVDGDITCAADGFPAPLMQMQYLENHFKYARVLQA